MTARELALNALYKIEVGEGYSNITLDKELNNSDLSKLDKALASEIVYGVLTWKITLDEIIKRYSSIRLKKISPWIINILRMGIYQIVFLDKIPESAAVNESVKLAKKYGHEASARFTNAILRKITKAEYQKLKDYIKTKPYTDEEEISIVTSHPVWMVMKLLKDYERNFVIDLLNSNNITPYISIRANTLKTSKEELKKLFDLKEIEYVDGKLPHSINLKRMITFDEQLFVVQDEAAQLACLTLAPKEGEIVLDACSSPGGKTTYISALMNNKGEVDAWDIHEHRVELVKKLASKLGITNIKAEVSDATMFYPSLVEKYDRILLDVPCSGIGVIRKKPDIKWTRNEEDLNEIQEIQSNILETCKKYLKKGGTLVYSTCTVFKNENEYRIKDFLENNPDFKLEKEIKLFPNVDGTDGFYIAKLVKE